jgi:hypothetical protein
MHKSRYKKASSRIAKRSRIKRNFGLFLKIGLPIALLIGLIFLLRADFLQVKSFEVVGAETVQPTEIKNVATNFISGNNLFFIPKSNILFLNKQKLTALLLSNFKRLEKVEVNKKYLSKSVQLNVTERKADFVWCSPSSECFLMTKDGLVFEKSGETGGKLIFTGLLEGDPLMKNFATSPKIQNYLKLVEIFKEGSIEVISINIESSDKAVAKTSIGDVIFNPEEIDLSLVAQNAILLINEVKGKNPSAKFNYIDARFDNKFFYKLI